MNDFYDEDNFDYAMSTSSETSSVMRKTPSFLHDLNSDLQWRETVETFRRIEAARSNVDNKKPESLKYRKYSKQRKISYEQKEHQRRLKHMWRRIGDQGTLQERKKNRFDPIAYPVLVRRKKKKKKALRTLDPRLEASKMSPKKRKRPRTAQGKRKRPSTSLGLRRPKSRRDKRSRSNSSSVFNDWGVFDNADELWLAAVNQIVVNRLYKDTQLEALFAEIQIKSKLEEYELRDIVAKLRVQFDMPAFSGRNRPQSALDHVHEFSDDEDIVEQKEEMEVVDLSSTHTSLFEHVKNSSERTSPKPEEAPQQRPQSRDIDELIREHVVDKDDDTSEDEKEEKKEEEMEVKEVEERSYKQPSILEEIVDHAKESVSMKRQAIDFSDSSDEFYEDA
ncbi:hypothetical protein PCE1_003786 [Barthelona sp. PCE]